MVERLRLPRLLVFVVAYQAQTTISQVLHRIPKSLSSDCDVEIPVIDDASTDRAFALAEAIQGERSLPYPRYFLANLRNRGFDLVALGNRFAAGWLLTVNRLLLRVSRSLFAYQIFLVAVPRLSLGFLLRLAETVSNSRAESLANVEEANARAG